MKQRIVAKSEKIRWYSNYNEQFCLNRIFFEQSGKSVQGTWWFTPGEYGTGCWRCVSILEQHLGWKCGTQYERGWPNDVRECIGRNSQTSAKISTESLKHQLRKVPNWKTPGPDGVQSFWIKKLTALHARITTQRQEILERESIPSWITLGKTVLCVKDVSKGNASDNLRPISCLPIMCKVFTGIIFWKSV